MSADMRPADPRPGSSVLLNASIATKFRRALLATFAVLAVAMCASGHGTTYARFSDDAVLHITAGAGVWTTAPDIPAACGPLSDYKGGVVVGTPGPDVLTAGNQGQVVLGLGGDDVITGGNSKDCLVGGDGNDRLIGGNAKDILLGGDGDDYLDGGNGSDTMDGGAGIDDCRGGNAPSHVVNCEPVAHAPLALSAPPESDKASSGKDSSAKGSSAKSDSSTTTSPADDPATSKGGAAAGRAPALPITADSPQTAAQDSSHAPPSQNAPSVPTPTADPSGAAP